MTKLQKRPSKLQVDLFYILKDQLDLIYKQLNHFKQACRSVDRLNRVMKDLLLDDDHRPRQLRNTTKRDGQLRAEFVKFKRNYRVSRRKLRLLDRKLLNVNLYDKLYDLYESLAIGESIRETDKDLKVDSVAVDEVCCNNPVGNNDDSHEVPDYVPVTTDSDSENSFEIELDPRQLGILEVSFSIDSPALPMADVDVDNALEFRCDQCDKSYETSSFLSVHKRSCHHNESRQYRCNWDGCDYRTQYKFSLKRHSAVHTGERPFKCTFEGCDYRTSANCHLKQHLTTHTGERPFKCTFEGCDYRTTRNEVLKRHLTVHTDVRPFRCDQCDKSFATSSFLSVHKRIHESDPRYRCTYEGCDYRTTRNGVLKRHLTVHTGERSFHCDQCDKSYATSSFLSIHKRSHDSKSRYKCNWDGCPYETTRNDLLKRHLTVHTGK